MSYIFLGIEIIGILVIVTALLLLLQGDGSREQKLMQYFLMGCLIQNMGYILELTAPTQEAAIAAVKMEYLGSLTVPISYCYFIFSYCFRKAPVKTMGALKVIDVLILGLVYTCDRHHLYYRQVEWLKAADGHYYLSLSYGPGYWLFMICCMAIPYGLSLYALLHACIEEIEYDQDRRYKLILSLSVLPVIALLCYSLKLTRGYDPTPVVLGLSLAIVVILMWSRKVYDFNSLAWGILLDGMSDGMIVLDEQKRVVSYNPTAADVFPDLNNPGSGKHVNELEGFPQGILGEDVREEFVLGGCCYQSHVKQIVDRYGKNTGYVILLLDVTETKNYIEEIKRVQKQAEAANTAKSAFLANMSHEIRTPMNAIVGLSDVIMEESRGRKVYEYARDIKSSSRNLLALINDILDLSKVEAGKMELVLVEYHVKTLVNEVLSMLDVVASERGIMLESEYDMSIPCRYIGDEGRIKQILINILNNALKFTKEGYVKISLTARGGEEQDIEYLIFQIEDTGCGIRKKDIGGIFENFKQVDSERNRRVEGTGLGLSITKRLVDLMQGTIGVDSIYGKGTTFTVEIPQKIVDARPLSEVPEEPCRLEEKLEPFLAPDFRVLVVDDNRINRQVAKLNLQPYGLQIEEADSGPAAIELVREKCYDIIFMDHMMPQMDGIEAVQIIRGDCGENGTRPVIIALTANAMEGVRETFLGNGFQDFLTKPLEIRRLHEALLKWIPKEQRTAKEQEENELLPDDNRHTEFRDILIEGIDIDEAARDYAGSVEEYKDLLQLYCLDGKRKIELLRELWEKRDYKSYGVEVHGLKSASRSIGAMKVSDYARELEQAVRRGDETYVDNHASGFLQDYEDQLRYIRDFLEKDHGKKAKEEEKPKIGKADLILELRGAFESLENFRAKDCAGRLESIRQYWLEEELEKKLDQIQDLLKLYEDDAAQDLLCGLLKQMEEDRE